MCTIVSSLALVAFSKKIVYIVHESMLLKRESMIDGIIKGLCKRESKMKRGSGISWLVSVSILFTGWCNSCFDHMGIMQSVLDWWFSLLQR